jgi:ABC-type multidrug transport system fused ATPase/permease subunit
MLSGKLINELYDLTESNRKQQLTQIIYYFILICVAWIVNAIAYLVMDYNDSKLIPDFSSFFRDYVIEKLFLQYETHFGDVHFGSVNTKLIVLPNHITEFLNIFLNYVFPRVFVVFLVMIYFLYIDYRIGSILFVSIFVYYYLLQTTLNDCIDLYVQHNEYYEKINELHKDSISNLFSIYSSGKTQDEIDESRSMGNQYRQNYSSSIQCTNRIKGISYAVNLVLFFSINASAIYLFVHKKISIAVLISIFLIVIYLLQYLMDISYWTPKLVEYYGTIVSSNEFVETLGNVVPDNRPSLTVVDGTIQLVDVSFEYDNKPLFKHFNMTVLSNQKICIIGKSGSGKSTFIKLIMGYYPIQSGAILIDNKNIIDYNVNSLRQNISYIHQNTVLFDKTLYENIVYGSSSPPSKERVLQMIRSMHLTPVFSNLSQGIDTPVGVNGNKISGGQKQIVLILREILNDKKILILDEPTSALDNETKQIVLRFVQNISNKTVIVISHDNDFLNYVDTSYLLKGGQMIPI